MTTTDTRTGAAPVGSVPARLLRRAAGRLKWWTWRERAVVAGTWTAQRVLPAQRTAVVHGWPDSEGNAVEVVRGLVRRYPGTVYWLRNGTTDLAATLPAGVPSGKVVSLRVGSLRAVLVAWRAEVTFFTHGLVTAVPPPRSRLVVNLWHGDGPKLTPGLPRCAATVAVAATSLWGRYKGELFGLRERDVAVVGNPRLDSVLDRTGSQTRRSLGLPEEPVRLVAWLPTYRQGTDGGHHSWANGEHLSASLGAGISVPEGVRLVVKPHPMDTDDYTRLGATVLTNETLAEAGVTLVQLLDACDALISDASSAWVDYLTFDRPIGFFLPDLDDYGAARGYNVPDLPAVLPGPVLTDLDAVERFLVEVGNGRAEVPSARPELVTIGYSVRLPVVDELFRWLDDYQRDRGARPLFGAAPVE